MWLNIRLGAVAEEGDRGGACMMFVSGRFNSSRKLPHNTLWDVQDHFSACGSHSDKAGTLLRTSSAMSNVAT